MVEMDIGRVGPLGLCGCPAGGEEWRELIVSRVSVAVVREEGSKEDEDVLQAEDGETRLVSDSSFGGKRPWLVFAATGALRADGRESATCNQDVRVIRGCHVCKECGSTCSGENTLQLMWQGEGARRCRRPAGRLVWASGSE